MRREIEKKPKLAIKNRIVATRPQKLIRTSNKLIVEILAVVAICHYLSLYKILLMR